jgi:ACS family tartrate transporter-like MFS transporter
MPPLMLTGAAAAAGIAWINAIGNLGGFFAPAIVGWAKVTTGYFSAGLYALAGFSLLSAVVSALWLHIPNPVASEEAARVAAE